jgi:hypothetical protein
MPLGHARFACPFEVIHWCLVSRVILYNIWLKTDLLAGGVLHKRDFNVTHLISDEGAIGSAPQLQDLVDPFFTKRRSPLDPESSRTLIVLFLTLVQS